MASMQTTVDFILKQVAAAGIVSAKKMFGEYGFFCDGKMVALVCDDQLFVKPTLAGEKLMGYPEYEEIGLNCEPLESEKTRQTPRQDADRELPIHL